jgi:hypothetical protein
VADTPYFCFFGIKRIQGKEYKKKAGKNKNSDNNG